MWSYLSTGFIFVICTFPSWDHQDHQVLAQWVHNDNMRKDFNSFIDDILTVRMPSSIVEKEKDDGSLVLGSDIRVMSA